MRRTIVSPEITRMIGECHLLNPLAPAVFRYSCISMLLLQTVPKVLDVMRQAG